jgi:hypothetical protein
MDLDRRTPAFSSWPRNRAGNEEFGIEASVGRHGVSRVWPGLPSLLLFEPLHLRRFPKPQHEILLCFLGHVAL